MTTIKGRITANDFDIFKEQVNGITIQALRHNGINVSDNPSQFELTVISHENHVYAKRHMDIDDRIFVQLYMGDKMIVKIEDFRIDKFEMFGEQKRYISEYEIFKVA